MCIRDRVPSSRHWMQHRAPASLLQVNSGKPSEEAPLMTSPETVEVPALRVVGISIRTTNQAETEAEPGKGPIAQLWQRFASLDPSRRIPNPHVSGDLVAIYHDCLLYTSPSPR